MKIYLDYNATTPIEREVFDAMLPFFKRKYGNPSSSYDLGREAKEAVESARTHVAKLLGTKQKELFFTASGSEANNTIFKGLSKIGNKNNHIITTNIEHPSIQEPLRFLEQQGFKITKVGVDQKGKVNVKEIEQSITPDTILVSVMHSNNEVGTLQPIREIGTICRKNNILFHSDASQSVGKVPIDVNELQVDLMTFAGHKFYAPKGIGGLYIRKGIVIEPLIHGASQESGQRAGTENVPYIVGMGKAAQLANSFQHYNNLLALKTYFYDLLIKTFSSKIVINGDFTNSLPNTLNISFKGESGQAILEKLPNLYASTGSACHSKSKTLSPVLKAMGVDEEIGYGAIRFSLGRNTSKRELEYAVKLLSSVIF